MEDRIRLTISILMSDRKETAEKCLKSLQPFFDELETELIVTDTGCSKETLEMVQNYTHKIIPFVWCNDFSAARNIGLKEAKGDWFLYLDDDEWFDDVKEITDFLNSHEADEYAALRYYQRNYTDFSGKNYTDVPVDRMVRRKPDIRFCYAVHELLLPVEGRVKQVNSFVHHYGYVYAGEEEKRAHYRRNVRILEQECAKYPQDIRMHLQLAEEHLIMGEYGDTGRITEKLVHMSGENRSSRNFSWLCDLHVKALFMQGRYQEILELADELLKDSRVTALCKLLLCYHSAFVCVNLERTGPGQAYLDIYFKLLDFFRKYPGELYNQQIQNLSEYVKREDEAVAEKLMCIFAWQNGDYDTAGAMLHKLDWEHDPHGLNRICKEIEGALIQEVQI